jgi:hypothetical protein
MPHVVVLHMAALVLTLMLLFTTAAADMLACVQLKDNKLVLNLQPFNANKVSASIHTQLTLRHSLLELRHAVCLPSTNGSAVHYCDLSWYAH